MKKFTLAAIAIALSVNIHAQWVATPDITGKSTFYTGGVLFTGSNYGITASTDEEQTSTPKNTGLTINGANYFVLGPKVGTTLYAFSNTVYLSADNGNTWQQANTGLPAINLTNLYAFNNVLYATYQSGAIYTSTDGGTTWTLKGNTGIYVVNLASYNGALYAGTSSAGVSKSTDGGATWSAVNTGIAAGDLQVYGSGVHNGSLYIGTYSGKVYKFTDATSSWTQIFTAGAAVRDFYTIGNALMTGGDNGFHYSLDDGTTWQADNAGLTGNAFYILDLHASNQNLFASDFYGGVYKRSLSELGIIIPNAVNEVANVEESITLFPNPATNTIHITGTAKLLSYNITDITGRQVTQQTANAQNTIDISNLNNGIYLCTLTTNKGTTIQKFVKQ
jgi:hypothetical protein